MCTAVWDSGRVGSRKMCVDQGWLPVGKAAVGHADAFKGRQGRRLLCMIKKVGFQQGVIVWQRAKPALHALQLTLQHSHAHTLCLPSTHRVGPDAAEIMQGLAIALKCGATKKQFDSTVRSRWEGASCACSTLSAVLILEPAAVAIQATCRCNPCAPAKPFTCLNPAPYPVGIHPSAAKDFVPLVPGNPHLSTTA